MLQSRRVTSSPTSTDQLARPPRDLEARWVAELALRAIWTEPSDPTVACLPPDMLVVAFRSVLTEASLVPLALCLVIFLPCVAVQTLRVVALLIGGPELAHRHLGHVVLV